MKPLVMFLLAAALSVGLFGFSIATPATAFIFWIAIMLIYLALRGFASRVTVHHSRLNFEWLMSHKDLQQK